MMASETHGQCSAANCTHIGILRGDLTTDGRLRYETVSLTNLQWFISLCDNGANIMTFANYDADNVQLPIGTYMNMYIFKMGSMRLINTNPQNTTSHIHLHELESTIYEYGECIIVTCLRTHPRSVSIPLINYVSIEPYLYTICPIIPLLLDENVHYINATSICVTANRQEH